MNDFRKILYERYVLTHKSEQIHRNEEKIQRFFRSYRHRFLPILEGVDLKSPVLDIGCGPGYLMEFLRMKGFKNIEGIDISPEQIKLAARQGLNASVADVFEFLSKRRGLYSVIFAVDFIEHFTKNELLSLFPLINGALKDNGLFILQTPNGQGLFPGQIIYGDLTHITIFAEDSLRQMMRLNGFEDLHFKETGPAPDSLSGKFNLFLWKIIRTAIRLVRQIEANNSSKIWTENIIAWGKKSQISPYFKEETSKDSIRKNRTQKKQSHKR